MGDRIGFQAKISILTIGIVLVTVLCLSASQIYMANTDALRQGREGLSRISNTLIESVALQESLMAHKLGGDRDILRGQFGLRGFPVPEVLLDAELDLVDQSGGEPRKAILPAMKHGSNYLHEDNSLVMAVAALTGGVVSVMQLHEGRLVRISTSLDNPVPLWGQGSYMSAGNPAFEAVAAGKVWEGLVWLGGAWRLTAYEPFTDLTGKQVLGALEIAHPLISDAFAKYVRKVGVGIHGGTVAFDAQGRVIIDMPDARAVVDGIIATGSGSEAAILADGKRIEVTRQTFGPWNLTFATWVETDDLMAGVRERLITNALRSMIAPLILSVILIGIAARVLLTPIRHMASLAEEVAGGNYTATVSYPANDTIGHLAGALNVMVAKSRDMLREIVAATEALSDASQELGEASGGLTGNTADTARRARAVHQSASGVSDNMHGVSAAMEQTTVNVGIVASSATELAATIQGVAQNAELAKRTTADAVVKAGETTRHMDQLRQAATDINAVTATIAAISSQTNLLALNATIEAARAGAAGRGFAVVAGEIKELAQQTSAATENIREMVSSIQGVTLVTARELAEIIHVVDEMNDIVGAIAEAMEEQAAMTHDISENINHAAQGIGEINGSVASSSSMTREIGVEIEGVLDASTTMQTESRVVQERADSLAGLAAHLRTLVGHFRF